MNLNNDFGRTPTILFYLSLSASAFLALKEAKYGFLDITMFYEISLYSFFAGVLLILLTIIPVRHFVIRIRRNDSDNGNGGGDHGGRNPTPFGPFSPGPSGKRPKRRPTRPRGPRTIRPRAPRRTSKESAFFQNLFTIAYLIHLSRIRAVKSLFSR